MQSSLPLSAVNLRWLARLRWVALLGQLTTIVVVNQWLDVSLPVLRMFALIAITALTNVGVHLWLRRRVKNVPDILLALLLALDVATFTGMLYLSGGPFNPFSFLYLVHIALAAVILRTSWTWMLTVFALLCFGGLFAAHEPLHIHGHDPQEHLDMHVDGMWAAFAVAAGLIVYFVQRVTIALASREEELHSARETAARTRQLASLATLAAGAAHELATPLGTIAVVAGELQRSLAAGGDPELRSDASLIREEVRRCREILDQMAVDVGSGRGENMQSISAGELLRDALSGESTQVVVENTADKTIVRAPRRAFTRLLRALLNNAIEATGNDPSKVHLRATERGPQVRIEIEDEGIGMSPHDLEHAIEPFYTTKHEEGGMGLGLFLAHTIAAEMGTTLHLESISGQGTKAWIDLPRAQEGQPV